MFIIVTDKLNKLLLCTPNIEIVGNDIEDMIVNKSIKLYIEDEEPIFTTINKELYYLDGKLFLEHEMN